MHKRLGIAAGALLVAGVAVLLWLRQGAVLRREELDLWQALLAELRAFEETEGPPRLPPPTDPAPGTAHDHWLAAARAFAGPVSGPTGARQNLARVAALLEPATRTVRLASPWSIVDRVDPGAPGPDDAIRRFLQTGTRSLLDEVLLRASEGNADEALDLAFLVDRAAADAGENNWLMVSLICLVARKGVRRTLADIVSRDHLPPDALDRLDSALRAASLPPVDEARLAALVAIEMQATFFHPVTGLLVTGPRRLALFQLPAPSPAEQLRDEVSSRLKALSRSRRVTLWRDFRETMALRPGEDLDGLTARVSTLERSSPAEMEKRLHRGTAFYLRTPIAHHAELRAMNAALRIGIAFHRYRLREGRVPATVEEILPPDVPATPPTGSWTIEEDPDTGQPCFSYESSNQWSSCSLRVR
jgi:hypothetical protein